METLYGYEAASINPPSHILTTPALPVFFIIEEFENQVVPPSIPNRFVIANKKATLQEWSHEKKVQKAVKDLSQLSWSCFLCGFQDKSYQKILHHFASIHDLNGSNGFCFQCCECDYISRWYVSILNHVRFQHYPELINNCDVCGMDFKYRKKLLYHRENNHKWNDAGKPKVYYCITCARAFATIEELNLHNDNHVFICEICDREFTEKFVFEIHKDTHSCDQFSCAVCESVFTTTCELEKHMKSHNLNILQNLGWKFYEETLTNGFGLSSTLKNTNPTSTNSAVCSSNLQKQHTNMNFSSPFTLPMHCSTEEKAYKCVGCNKRFKSISEIKRHIQKGCA